MADAKREDMTIGAWIIQIIIGGNRTYGFVIEPAGKQLSCSESYIFISLYII